MNILIADDEKGIRRGLVHLFQREGFTVYEAAEYGEAIHCCEVNEIHVALLDMRLGDRDGIDLLKELLQKDADMICLMITGYGSIQNAVEAMQFGAADYLLKPLDNEKLLQAVGSRMELKKLKSENSFLKSELKSIREEASPIYGSPAMKKILSIADRVKDTDATILITGESGTGKEVLCRYIHESSTRKEAPFIGVNCAALSETLLLSELFGHEKGAFTGAAERKPGKFELAHRGTLFLDEIGDMSLEAQAKLLRVLEEGAFERVGGTRLIGVDIRLIAATNQDLQALIRDKRFREDLFYRLNVISMRLPPLRDRKEDIPMLCDYFCQFYCKRYRKNFPEISQEDRNLMLQYSWPGNVRELKNMINQVVLLSNGGALDLPVYLKGGGTSAESVHPFSDGNLQDHINSITEDCERNLIEQALLRNKYNRTSAAEELGVTRKTLFNKISKYNL